MQKILDMIPNISDMQIKREQNFQNAVEEIVRKINFEEARGYRHCLYYPKPNENPQEIKKIFEEKIYTVQIKTDSDSRSGDSKYLEISWY